MKADRAGKKKIGALAAILVVVVLALLAWTLLGSDDNGRNNKAGDPHAQRNVERSRESMCNYRRDNPEPSGFAASAEHWREIERRAPADIVNDVAGLRKTYEDVVKDPDNWQTITLEAADANDIQLDRISAYCKNNSD